MRLSLLVLLFFVTAAAPAQDARPFSFYAMDTGLRGPDVPSAETRVALLKKLGYAGIGYTFNPDELPGMLKLLDDAGLELSALYCNVTVGKPLDPRLLASIRSLKGRPTRVELAIHGAFKRGDAEGDALAVKMLHELADAADATGPVLSIYPHIGFYAASEDDALRLVRKAGRKNLGLNFNLYHSPRRLKIADMEVFLKDALPHLLCVTINGLHKGRIVPLNQGKDVDVAEVVRMVKGTGYRGRIGLQAYGVPGPSAVHLAASMKRWNEISAK